MISALQQQQLEKYVHEFQTCATEGNDPEKLRTLVPEFYHFVGGCMAQVENALERSTGLNDDEQKAAEGLVNNLNTLQSSLLTTSQQLGIDLEAEGHTIKAEQATQEVRVIFDEAHQENFKNSILQAIRKALDVEAPLAESHYVVEREADHMLTVRVTAKSQD